MPLPSASARSNVNIYIYEGVLKNSPVDEDILMEGEQMRFEFPT